MKKIVFVTALLLFGLAVQASVKEQTSLEKVYGDPKWKKSAAGTWMGANKTWYKLNPSDASVWMSKDGKEWMAVSDGMWQDADGKWLKIVEKDLKWSADGGKTWASVPEWKWKGADNKWYKFDKDWTLWVA